MLFIYFLYFLKPIIFTLSLSILFSNFHIFLFHTNYFQATLNKKKYVSVFVQIAQVGNLSNAKNGICVIIPGTIY